MRIIGILITTKKMSKMRILKINFNVPGFAGDTPQIFHIAKGLLELGHTVDYVTTDADAFFYDKEKSEKYEEIRKKLLESTEKQIPIFGINVIPLHCTNEKLAYYCPHASSFAKSIIKNYDVVHIYNWYFHIAKVFSQIAHKYKIPFIFTANGSIQPQARALKKNSKRIFDVLYTNKMIKQASILHSVGDLETELYLKFGAKNDDVVRIDHGVNLDYFQVKNKTGILQKNNLDENQEYLLYVSRIDKKKGLEILLQGFKKILVDYPNLILVITGTGEMEYLEQIHKLVKNLKIENSLRFTGFVSEEEKLELLSKAKIFTVISHSDVHTIAAQEALAMGIPVVISKASDWPEIDEYRAGISVDTNPDSVYDAFKKLLSDKESLKEYGNNARKLIEKKFQLKNLIKKYESMYEKAIKNNIT